MANQIAHPMVLALCLFGLMLQAAEANFSAIFVFGDSTLDVGNNNYLNNTKAKANFPHYGVDYPYSISTGRFSNGYNTADQLAQLLGFPMSPPPYLSLTTNKSITDQMYKGINFASGGSGLLDNTGKLFAGEVISMSVQLHYFSSVVEKINTSTGDKGTADFLSKSLIFISTGSNDMFEYSNRTGGNDTEFLSSLIDSYKDHLQTLYGFGARKFSIVSIPPLGCCPAQRVRNTTVNGGCFEALNSLSQQFYPMLGSLLQELQHDKPDMAYSLANAFEMVSFIFKQPKSLNITELKVACCGSGQFGENGCNQTAPLCANRTDHLFWDSFHPTQAVSGIAAQTLYSGPQAFVYPVNVGQLAMMG